MNTKSGGESKRLMLVKRQRKLEKPKSGLVIVNIKGMKVSIYTRI